MNFQVQPEYLSVVLGNSQFSIRHNYYDMLKPWFDSNQIPYLDLLPLMERKPDPYYNKNGEAHLNPNGLKFVAEQIKAELDRRALP